MTNSLRHQWKQSENGFSLVELLIVTTIIGILLAVIIPRAQRAKVSAKYNIVRQNATELGKWANEWIERNLESQDESATCVEYQYADTLLDFTASTTNVNWVTVNNNLTAAGNCRNGGTGINFSIQDIMPADKALKNPFNGLSYFNAGNDPANVVPGAIILEDWPDPARTPGNQIDYYFLYLGTDSTSNTDYHGGMGTASLGNLKNGVFMTQTRVP